jgi:hypothetical protein
VRREAADHAEPRRPIHLVAVAEVEDDRFMPLRIADDRADHILVIPQGHRLPAPRDAERGEGALVLGMALGEIAVPSDVGVVGLDERHQHPHQQRCVGECWKRDRCRGHRVGVWLMMR